MNVVSIFSRSLMISARIWLRSLASRLDSGSSIRKTFGLRTMARPMATRCRWPPDRGLGLTVEVLRDVEDLGGLFDLAVDLRLGDLLQLEGEGHVIINGHVGIERVVLEDHGDVAVLRGDVVHELAVDIKFTLGDLFQTGDHAERCGFAAAGRADEDDKLPVFDVQIELLDGDDALLGDLKVVFLLGDVIALFLLFFFSSPLTNG